MGRKPDLSQEEQRLRQATRDAHEAAQHLADVIREARILTATLTASYQDYHDQEIKSLSNALAIEHNQAARDLNQAIENAKIMIKDQIMAGEAVFDATTRTVAIRFGAGAFDDNQPLPYPHLTDRTTAP